MKGVKSLVFVFSVGDLIMITLCLKAKMMVKVISQRKAKKEPHISLCLQYLRSHCIFRH